MEGNFRKSVTDFWKNITEKENELNKLNTAFDNIKDKLSVMLNADDKATNISGEEEIKINLIEDMAPGDNMPNFEGDAKKQDMDVEGSILLDAIVHLNDTFFQGKDEKNVSQNDENEKHGQDETF